MNSDTLRSDEPQDAMKHYAEVADASYGAKDLSHLGYTIDPEHSNRNRTLYTNRDGKAIMSFRGTDLKSKSKYGDIGSDVLLGLGLKNLSARFKNSRKATQKAINTYGRDNLVLVGHSLAGSQALYNNSKFGLETHAYNPGISPSDAIEGIKKKVFDKLTFNLFKKPVRNNATIYHTGKEDAISALSPLVMNANVKQIKKKKGNNAHAISNFF